jgi:MFS family permease
MRSRWTRLLPIMLVTFIISFLDRTNIGFAIPLMGEEINLTPTALGFASGFLFIGYGLTQPIGGWLADRGRARNLVTVLLVVWGIAGILQAFVTDGFQLVIVRFILGAAEGGIFPAFLVMIRNWFTSTEQSRANGLWQLCYPVAAMVSGPVAGYLIELTTWRGMFVIEGAFPILWALVWHLGVTDSPRTARWLSDAERTEVLDAVEAGRSEPVQTEPFGSPRFREQLRRRVVILFTAAVILWNVGFLALVIWLPSAIQQQSASLSSVAVGWLSAVPYAVAVVGLLVMTRQADRTGRRWQFCVGALAVAAAALLTGALFPTSSLAFSLVALSIAAAGIYGAWPILWSIPSMIIPAPVLGAVLGAVNGLGVLGAFAGPYVVGWIKTATGSFSMGLATVAAALVGAAICIIAARIDRAALDRVTA